MFRILEVLRFGWDAFREHASLLIGLHVTAWLAQTAPGLLGNALFSGQTGAQGALAFLGVVLGLIVTIGLTRAGLRFADGERATYGDLIAQAHLLFRYFLGNVLYAALVAAIPVLLIVAGSSGDARWLVILGSILLAAPGIVLAVQFSLWGYFMVDRELGPIASLRASSRATSGVRLRLFLFYLTCLGLVLLSCLPLFLGLLVSMPLLTVSGARVFRLVTAGDEGKTGAAPA